MNDVFLGNCCESDNCLEFTCKWYTPWNYNHETVPGPTWCDKADKLVFIRPLVETQVVELEEMEGIVEGK